MTADPPVNLADPVPRPTWLEVPRGEALGKYPTDEWLDGVVNALPAADRTSDGGIVLAELTSIASVDHDREEESRLAVIAHRDLPFRNREPDIYELPHEERYAAWRYPEPFAFDASIPVAVMAGGAIFADSRYVALNPMIGAQLGWRISADGLFRWVDQAGRTMVESIFWAEGNVDVHDGGGLHETASEGWLVIASADAWRLIRPLVARFVRHRVAARQTGYSRGGDRAFRRAYDTLPLPSA